MIALCKPTGTTTRGAVVFSEKPESEFRVAQPRVKRTATLDGGAVIDHQGYSVGDRTINVRASLAQALADDIWLMVKESTNLILSCGDGAFYGAVQDLRIDRGNLALTFLVKEAA